MIPAFQKVHFVQYGPWGVEAMPCGDAKRNNHFGPWMPSGLKLLQDAKVYNRMVEMTVYLTDWHEKGSAKAFQLFNMALWLHLDTAFELIRQRLGLEKASQVTKHICMQSATPFVMSVPLDMSTIYAVAQWMRTPNDVLLNRTLYALVQAQVTSPEHLLVRLWQQFATLFQTNMPFGFVHSKITNEIAVFVTGPNAQFAGAIYSMDRRHIAESRLFCRMMVARDKSDKKTGVQSTNYRATAIMERFAIAYGQLPWIVARANESCSSDKQLFCALVLSSRLIFVHWKTLQQQEKISQVDCAVNMMYWRSIGSSIQSSNAAYFTFTALIVEKRDEKKGMTLQCREHSQLMLSVLLANQ